MATVTEKGIRYVEMANFMDKFILSSLSAGTDRKLLIDLIQLAYKRLPMTSLADCCFTMATVTKKGVRYVEMANFMDKFILSSLSASTDRKLLIDLIQLANKRLPMTSLAGCCFTMTTVTEKGVRYVEMANFMDKFILSSLSVGTDRKLMIDLIQLAYKA
ncbi:hypothetical protein Dimus_034895 [Dionaea muscipula]